MSEEIIRNLYILAALGLATAIWFRHPFPFLIAFVSFSLAIGEFYPFSNFPMYSDPDDRENYFVLSAIPDQNNIDQLPEPKPGSAPANTPYYQLDGMICRPLPSYPFTGLTAPTIKKMFKSRMNTFAKKHGTKRKHLNSEQRRQLGEKFLLYIREESQKSTAPRRGELPEKLALLEFWIEPDRINGGFIETPTLVAHLPAQDQN
ncbi:MAG: hypothetical protein L3J39_10420 [Verrucomicrobiales bacterium]|nr:hypothetical protein [Verrucomicrobiales bacterium]